MKTFLAIAVLVFALGMTPARSTHVERATGTFAAAAVPYLPGSAIPIALNGIAAPYHLSLLGPGSLDDDLYRVPNDARGSASLFASAPTGLAAHTFTFAPPPDPKDDFVAVASYDDGIIIHDASPPFSMTAALAVGGPPGDVAIDSAGMLASATTDGDTATLVRLQPWATQTVSGVPFADEMAFDSKTHALFLTNRDVNGVGALTRVASDGAVSLRLLGNTAEGLAIDSNARRIYVANVNDGTISIVDADSMVELSRFKAVARVFGLALSRDGTRLYAVSNQSTSSPFGAPGSAVAIDVRGPRPRIVAHSLPLSFPVGVVLDERDNRLFVTDEKDDDVYILDPKTLRPLHPPLRTCETPWKPALDEGRLYVPCARADEVDVFDARTLNRASGAPFATGGYPLAIAFWHGR